MYQLRQMNVLIVQMHADIYSHAGRHAGAVPRERERGRKLRERERGGAVSTG